VPVLESFRKWLEEQKLDALPKSPTYAAIGYVQNHWEALIRYASSGYLAIDNNVSEQHMKTIATGRKNWLFTGSEQGGKTMAILFSVVSSCQRHGHDPFVYLRDVLGRLPGLPKERLAELLPTVGRRCQLPMRRRPPPRRPQLRTERSHLIISAVWPG
jgi:transposase